MKYGKWIGSVIGFMASGPLGALAGYAIGSLFDRASDEQKRYEESPEENRSFSEEEIYEGRRNSFLFSLLVLA